MFCLMRNTPVQEGNFKSANFQYTILKQGYTLSVLGKDKGYTVKYSHLPEGVPKGTVEGKGLYLAVHLKSSPLRTVYYFRNHKSYW